MNTACPLCHQGEKGELRRHMTEHFLKTHPEYNFVRKTVRGDHMQLLCGICGCKSSSYKQMVYHQESQHPGKLNGQKPIQTLEKVLTRGKGRGHAVNFSCPICRQDGLKHSMGEHFQKIHPEYGFIHTIKNAHSRYVCSICKNDGVGSFRGLVYHYQLCHPDKIDTDHLVQSYAEFSTENVITLVSRQMERIAELEKALALAKNNHQQVLKSGERLAVLLQNAQEQLARR